MGEDTVAEFVIDPGVLGAVTTIVMFGAAPGARLPPVRLQVTVPDTLLQVQFERAVALTKVVPAGIVSTTLTADASSGPAFDTPMVYVNVPLMNTGSGLSVFVIERSATWTDVKAVTVLFPAVLSLGDVTVAVFERVCAALGAVTTIVIVALVFAASVAMLQLVVVVPEHVHPVAVLETKVVLAGIVSVTTTFAAGIVAELFVTVIV